ncbi:MAG: methylated-DNA--[protein]-cysteine S-methyltransferase [Helicobacter sp.]|nr:methylated-DNA--[protein]-cysteine S-methyltransferase [Helicobacter sp.]
MCSESTSTFCVSSPVGNLLLTQQHGLLTRVWFDTENNLCTRGALPQVIAQTCAWLDSYFAGKVEPLPPFSTQGSPFCQEVWEILLTIPYGSTTTYRAIAERIASQRGIAKMSAQAVGGAVARNPIAIIIPCHRVIGANGALTGYAGGINKKAALLQWEQEVLE